MSQLCQKSVSLATLPSGIRRNTSHYARIFATLLLCVPSIALAEFCAVDNFGNVSNCFPSADMCRNWIRSWVGGGCVFRQGGTGGGGEQTDFDKMISTLNNLGKQLGQQRQQESNSLRANTPSFLIPLSSDPMSRETVAIITSTLNTALELDGARTTRNWKNPATGSQGLVAVDGQKSSQYGSVCREFFVMMDFQGKRKGVKGNACRTAGEWKILGSTPVEFRDGKIVDSSRGIVGEASTAEPDAPSTDDAESKKAGDACSYSGECSGDLICAGGRCLQQKMAGDPCRDAADCSGALICKEISRGTKRCATPGRTLDK